MGILSAGGLWGEGQSQRPQMLTTRKKLNTSVYWRPLSENRRRWSNGDLMLDHYVWHWPTLTHHWPNILRFTNRRSVPPPLPSTHTHTSGDVVPAAPCSEYSCPGHKVIIPILCIYQSIAGSNANIGVCYCHVAQWLEFGALQLSLPAARVQSPLGAGFQWNI